MARLPAVFSSVFTPASCSSSTYICSITAASVNVGPPTTTVAPPPAAPEEVEDEPDEELEAALKASPPPPQAASETAVRAAPAARAGRRSARRGWIDMRAHLLCPAAWPRVSGRAPTRPRRQASRHR